MVALLLLTVLAVANPLDDDPRRCAFTVEAPADDYVEVEGLWYSVCLRNQGDGTPARRHVYVSRKVPGGGAFERLLTPSATGCARVCMDDGVWELGTKASMGCDTGGAFTNDFPIDTAKRRKRVFVYLPYLGLPCEPDSNQWLQSLPNIRGHYAEAANR